MGGGGRVCVSKGEALDRGTKFRAGGGYGGWVWEGGVRDCLDVF